MPIDNLWDRLISKDIIVSKEDVEGSEKDTNGNDVYTLNTKDGYTVEIIVNETGLPEIGAIVKGALPPVIRKIEATSTENGIKAKATVSRLKNGSVEFWYKISTEDESEYKPMPFISNEEGATVDENGLVTAVANGSAVITASTADGSNLQATCNITVKIPVESVILNVTSTQIKPNATITLVATVNPENAINKNVTWSITSGSAYVSINSTIGVVTGVAEGTATITVTSSDDTTKKASCTIKVSEEDNWEEIAKWAGQIAKDSSINSNSEFATVNLTGGGTKSNSWRYI